jgi:hypothetical protein
MNQYWWYMPFSIMKIEKNSPSISSIILLSVSS